MKLVVGLGNPGPEYQETKHNVGFWLLDAFADAQGLHFSSQKKSEALFCKGSYSEQGNQIDFLLAKPMTYMNLSGHAVQTLAHYYKIPPSDLILVYDDLDLKIGQLRLRRKGRDGGHNGVASVIQQLGSEQFPRIKIGIGKSPRSKAANYVLSPFLRDEKTLVQEAVARGLKALPLLLNDQMTEAMNQFNVVQSETK